MITHFGFFFLFIAILELMTSFIYASSLYLSGDPFLFQASSISFLFLLLGFNMSREQIKKMNYNVKQVFEAVVLEIHPSLLYFASFSIAFFFAYDPTQWIYLVRGGIELSLFFAFRPKTT